MLKKVKPYLFPKCKLFYFNRETLEIGTINENIVTAQKQGNQIHYSLIINHNPKILIVQALNEKIAAGKFLSIIKNSN